MPTSQIPGQSPGHAKTKFESLSDILLHSSDLPDSLMRQKADLKRTTYAQSSAASHAAQTNTKTNEPRIQSDTPSTAPLSELTLQSDDDIAEPLSFANISMDSQQLDAAYQHDVVPESLIHHQSAATAHQDIPSLIPQEHMHIQEELRVALRAIRDIAQKIGMDFDTEVRDLFT